MRVNVAQDYSARDFAGQLQLRKGGQYEVQTVVGTTPEGFLGGKATAHYCSSNLRLLKTVKPGRGRTPDRNENYEVVHQGNILVARKPAVIQFPGLWDMTGDKLCISRLDGPVLAVTVPSNLLGESPWAYASCYDLLFRAYGVRTIEELFRKHAYEVEFASPA